MNIWQSLKKPIYILAPMEDVTDTVFRRMIASCGRPDLFFTEFTNVEGMCSQGDAIVSQRLLFSPEEKPLIAQIWGKEPKHYFLAAQKIAAMGFDGIDINMGCPEKSIVKSGCCSGLILNHNLAHEIIEATRKGADGLPISVKTRIGVHTIVTEEWIPFLLSHHLDALTIHARTAKEMSSVPVHWEELPKIVDYRNALSPQTILIANGDILTIKDAEEKAHTYGVDGIMIGRGIFQNPYLFSSPESWETSTVNERVLLLKRHVQLYSEIWRENKHYPILKKFYKIYLSSFDNATEIRTKFMETSTVEEALALADTYLNQ